MSVLNLTLNVRNVSKTEAAQIAHAVADVVLTVVDEAPNVTWVLEPELEPEREAAA